jgi:hypothetical protein
MRPTQQDGSDRQSDVAAADDSGGEGMKISPEQARANIVVEYERQLNEGVSVLSSAMERMRGITTAKVKSEIDSQPNSSVGRLHFYRHDIDPTL